MSPQQPKPASKERGHAAPEVQHGPARQSVMTGESYAQPNTEESQDAEAPVKAKRPATYDPIKPLLTTEEYAFEKCEHVDTTRKRQREGGGPPFVVDEQGRIRYWRKALDEYYAKRLVNNRHEADALLRRDRQQKEEKR